MAIDRQRVRQCLCDFDFKTLFIEELGWDRFARSPLEVEDKEGGTWRLAPLAEKGGVTAFLCQSADKGGLPNKTTVAAIEKVVKGHHFEHLIVFTDSDESECLWVWVKRQAGKQARIRTKVYQRGQTGERLVQSLEAIAFELSDLDPDGTVPVTRVTGRLERAFDVDRVTKRFYDEFQHQHAAFLGFLKGIPVEHDAAWYASVMLNRLMFIYFIQKKGFLDRDAHYLAHKLSTSRGRDRFYRDFLIRLFFEGFAQDEKDRSKETNALLGRVPYLDGGLFMPHQLEQQYGERINIADSAFERLFAFFEKYEWHLDDRPLRADNEINPDVLGYIFEKYINQKQMGAYYTKEDITDYICKNTIVPFLFDKLASRGPVGQRAVKPFPMTDVEPYIYGCLKHGMDRPLPADIAAGVAEVAQRTGWNAAAPPEYALPTEIWREVVARRRRVEQIRADFAAGKVASINDLVTYNLDIRRFAEDWTRGLADPAVLHLFYFEVLTKVTVLDPACGSGAFLFAAMNILEPLYEICLDRMAAVVANPPKKIDGTVKRALDAFAAELKRIASHPNRRYFVYKSIIVNNLFGVDIMEEAVEICKLRLFLKLVALIDDPARIEPLPDIDFNIKAGNSLVGYASRAEIETAVAKRKERFPLLPADPAGLMQKVKDVDRALAGFRAAQTTLGINARDLKKAKGQALTPLHDVEEALNADLAADYGVLKDAKIPAFVQSHMPFHWYVAFYDIMERGGFDVIVGNPPYVEYSKVRRDYQVHGYTTEPAGNLYAFFAERGYCLLGAASRFGFIVQAPIVSTARMAPVRTLLREESDHLCYATFDDRPSKLFDGMNHCRLAIVLARAKGSGGCALICTTRYHKWSHEERQHLFPSVFYLPVSTAGFPDIVPKFRIPLELSIFDKLRRCSHQIGDLIAKADTDYAIYYKITGVGHWFTFTLTPPKFWRDGVEARSTRENAVYFDSELIRNTVYCCLWSTLSYWIYQARTNCRDFNPSDLAYLPLAGTVARGFPDASELASALTDCLERTCDIAQGNYAIGGSVRYQKFRPRCAKPIIDEIDRILARHYQFSDDELDFIVNYDIKYRMGVGEGDDDA
jgi:hypothetical protein